ncbi:MAG: HAD family hydrolase [Alphaproteobacteria bacterium]|nr:HAD family hydrolase [Alphaproteobacteria bacterium]
MKRKGLFLDRDGVINEDVGYIGQIDRFVFKPGIFDFLRKAQDHGYVLVIVTNQSGVARCFYTREDHLAVTRWMMKKFAEQGIVISGEYACFEHPDAKDPAYCRQSYWRKPNPGMILEAAVKLSIDLASSAMVGDTDRDLQAAQAAHVGQSLLLGDGPSRVPDVVCVPDFEKAALALGFVDG